MEDISEQSFVLIFLSFSLGMQTYVNSNCFFLDFSFEKVNNKSIKSKGSMLHGKQRRSRYNRVRKER